MNWSEFIEAHRLLNLDIVAQRKRNLMRRRTTKQWKQVGSVLVPARIPEKVGLGCPKCDDHELVTFTRMQEDEEKKRIEAFVKKHGSCGVLATLEVHEGRLEQTGELREPS